MAQSIDPAQLTVNSRIVSGNLLCMASMAVWAAGFPAADILLRDWDIATLVAARFALALSVLLPLWVWRDGIAALQQANWPRGLFVGALAFGGGAWLILVAQWLTDPVTVAIIAASSPICATLIEWAYDRRPLTTAFALGLVASVIGGIVATGGGAAPANLGLGALAAIGSCILFAWGSYMSVRDFPTLSVFGRTTITLSGGLIAAVVLFLLSASLGRAALPAPPDMQTIGLLMIYGIGGMALSQLLWIASVERLGVAIASFHTNIAPFYVMLILLALGGIWSWPQAIGALVVALGAILAQR